MKIFLFVFLITYPILCFNQNIENITGKVVYKDGSPAIGATVTLSDKSVSTLVGNDGTYIFHVKSLNISNNQKVELHIYQKGYEYITLYKTPNFSGNIDEITLNELSGIYVKVKDSLTGRGLSDVLIYCNIATGPTKLTNQIGLYFIPINDMKNEKRTFFISITKSLEYYDCSLNDLSFQRINEPIEIKMKGINTNDQYEFLKLNYLKEISRHSEIILQKDTSKILECEYEIWKIYNAIQNIIYLSPLNNTDRENNFFNFKNKKFINDIYNHIEFLEYKKGNYTNLINSITNLENKYNNFYLEILKENSKLNELINNYNEIFEVGCSLYKLYKKLDNFENSTYSQDKIRENLENILLAESTLFDNLKTKLSPQQRDLMETSINKNSQILDNLY